MAAHTFAPHAMPHPMAPGLTTAPMLESKAQIRLHTWGQMAAHDMIVENARHKYYSIPDFKGASKAAFRLMRTDQFRNAKKIYVDTQPCSRLLEQIVAFSGKDLFVPASRESAMACQVFRAVQTQNLPEILKSLEDTSTDTLPENTPAREAVETAYDIVSTYFVNMHPFDMEALDLVIVGCVAVSPSIGHCVGRGFGHIDQSLATLQHMGGITERTVVCTIVHEDQLLPSNYQLRHIFQAHDFPVDLIVTPFFHHAIFGRSSRPERLMWERISSRRMACSPLLEMLHEELSRRGLLVPLKDDDSDVESSRIQRNPNLAKYHKNRGTVDELRGAELQAYNLVIFGRHPNEPAAGQTNTGAPQHQQQQQQHQQPQHQQTHHQHQQPQQTQTLSTVSNEEGKDQYRYMVWQRFQRHGYGQQMLQPGENYKIPVIPNVDAAAQRLAASKEFQTSQHILIFNQTNTEAIGLSAVHHSKQLYVPSPQNSASVIHRVQPPPGLHTNGVLGPTYFSDNGMRQMQTRRPAFLNVDAYDTGVPMPFEPMLELDMIVIGAVVAARNGRVIGTGNGAADLQFGILMEAGAVPHWTKVVAIVDDIQLLDELPDREFTAIDMPVDMIVTPTQLIHVSRPPKRPTGLQWRLLRPEHVQAVAVLSALWQRCSRRQGEPVPLMRPPQYQHQQLLPSSQQQPPFDDEPLHPMGALAAFMTDDQQNRAKRLKQYENCISFTFFALPENLTRQAIYNAIELQMGAKAFYIKHSKRKCRAYVYFHNVSPMAVHALYVRCANLVFYNERHELAQIRVVCNEPHPYGYGRTSDASASAPPPQPPVMLNHSISYSGMMQSGGGSVGVPGRMGGYRNDLPTQQPKSSTVWAQAAPFVPRSRSLLLSSDQSMHSATNGNVSMPMGGWNTAVQTQSQTSM